MLDKIKEILAQYADVDLDEVTEESRLAEDLGLSSLDFMSFLGELEDTFDVELDPEQMSKEVYTISDAIRMIEAAQ